MLKWTEFGILPNYKIRENIFLPQQFFADALGVRQYFRYCCCEVNFKCLAVMFFSCIVWIWHKVHKIDTFNICIVTAYFQSDMESNQILFIFIIITFCILVAGYKSIQGQVLQAEELKVLFNGLKENEIDIYSHFLTG